MSSLVEAGAVAQTIPLPKGEKSIPVPASTGNGSKSNRRPESPSIHQGWAQFLLAVEKSIPVPASTGNGSKSNRRPESPSIHQGWAQFLLAETNALTAVYASAVANSRKHGELVNPQDVLSLLIAAFQLRRGGPNVA